MQRLGAKCIMHDSCRILSGQDGTLSTRRLVRFGGTTKIVSSAAILQLNDFQRRSAEVLWATACGTHWLPFLLESDAIKRLDQNCHANSFGRRGREWAFKGANADLAGHSLCNDHFSISRDLNIIENVPWLGFGAA